MSNFITGAIMIAALLAAAPEVIEIPAGVAVVGADREEIISQLKGTSARPHWYSDESPRRAVEAPAFFIDRTEVTNRRYKTQVANHTFPPNLADHPVVNVTFVEAETFCHNAGGRLPSETEWERAARGDKGFIYPWGNEFDGRLAVYKNSGGANKSLKIGSYDLEVSSSSILGGTHLAGSIPKGASPFGLLDMAGNVWEWVNGYYDQKRGLRILKGGSWLTPKSSLRASTRLGDPGLKRYNDIGFRCAYMAAP